MNIRSRTFLDNRCYWDQTSNLDKNSLSLLEKVFFSFERVQTWSSFLCIVHLHCSIVFQGQRCH